MKTGHVHCACSVETCSREPAWFCRRVPIWQGKLEPMAALVRFEVAGSTTGHYQLVLTVLNGADLSGVPTAAITAVYLR